MGRRQGAATLGESGYERREFDAYFTEPWVTEQLLRHCNIRSPVWEPAAGRGDMVEVLAASGRSVIASDVADHGHGVASDVDFLATTPTWIDRVGSIVTNPPYAHADGFIRHALDLMRPQNGQVAMLVRLEFLSAASRRWMRSQGAWSWLLLAPNGYDAFYPVSVGSQYPATQIARHIRAGTVQHSVNDYDQITLSPGDPPSCTTST